MGIIPLELLGEVTALTKALDRDELRKQVETRGPLSPEENLRIYDKWFANASRWLFRLVDAKYGISEKILCDIGCSYGMNLPFCKEDSYGIEVSSEQAAFGQALGLPVHHRDAVTDDLSDLPKVEAIWCCAVMEHVEAPHILLRKMHMLLRDNGLLILYVPTIPLLPGLARVPGLRRFMVAHTANDHINAFTPQTLRFSTERAGFRTLEVAHPMPGVLGRLIAWTQVFDGCLYVGSKISGWDYPFTRSSRRVAYNGTGFARR